MTKVGINYAARWLRVSPLTASIMIGRLVGRKYDHYAYKWSTPYGTVTYYYNQCTGGHWYIL